MTRSYSISVFLLITIGQVFGQTLIRVPQDQSTIQAAINVSVNGDTVIVAEGTYPENIVVKKKIILASLFLVDGDTSHISKTIIDGSNPDHPDSGSVVTLDAGTDTTSLLMGLTIRGGKGNLRGGLIVGCGIDVSAGGAKIVRNKITENSAINANYARGGGISIWDATQTGAVSFVIVESNVISRNTVHGSSAEAGAIASGHAARIEGNFIFENSALSTVASNGGGLRIWNATVSITNNIIARNNTSDDAGAMFVGPAGDVRLVNNTIVFNSSRGAPGIRVSQGSLRMLNNIFWNPGKGAEVVGIGPTWAYNNLIRGSYYGENTINVNPGFSDSIFYMLATTSPCISAGMDSAVINGITLTMPTKDVYGNPRPFPSNTKADLGATESSTGTSSPYVQDAQQTYHSFVSQGIPRYYSLFRPKNYASMTKLPTVIAFTGCGGTSEFGTGTGLQQIADSAGFVLVSPQPFMNCWTDGGAASLLGTEDIVFVSQLIDTVIANYKADNQRIYLCGLSSGAFLSLRLASHFSNRIRAVAAVAGTMPSKTAYSNPPSNPVAMAIFAGTNDAAVPYGGSPPYKQGVDSTIIKWRSYNGCNATATIEDLPNLDENDGCTVQKITYRNCSSGEAVVLYKIEGGAHNWAGLVLPNLVRPLTMDVFASAEIFKFFTSPLSAVEEVGQMLPPDYSLGQNYPNPFNPSTTIQYSIPSRSFVTLRVFDLLGREVNTLVSEELGAGTYSAQWDASGRASGVYLYRLQAGRFVETKKLLLLR